MSQVPRDKKSIDAILERLDSEGVSRRDVLKLSAVGVATAAAAGLHVPGASGAVSVRAAKSGKLVHLILTPNTYTGTMGKAGGQVAKVLNLATFSDANEDLDPVKSVNLAKSFIARGYNMIWVGGIDGSEVKPTTTAADKAKAYHSQMWAAAPWYMPVDAKSKYYTAFWDLHDPQNMYGSTLVMLEALSKRLGNKEGKVFHIAGFPGGSLAFRRTAGVKQALAKFPKIKLVGELAGKWDPVVAQKAAQDLIGKYGNPDAIICSNDSMLTGVLSVVKAQGMRPGTDVLLCGQDGNLDILNAIKRGEVYSTNFHGPHTFALHPIVRMYDTMHGVEFTPIERQMWVDGITVTSKNVSGLLDRYYGDPDHRLPFSPKLASRVFNPKTWDPQVSLQPIDIVDYWKGLVKRPASYKVPSDYAAQKANGGMSKITKLYKAHNKVKMDNFKFRGVKV